MAQARYPSPQAILLHRAAREVEGPSGPLGQAAQPGHRQSLLERMRKGSVSRVRGRRSRRTEIVVRGAFASLPGSEFCSRPRREASGGPLTPSTGRSGREAEQGPAPAGFASPGSIAGARSVESRGPGAGGAPVRLRKLPLTPLPPGGVPFRADRRFAGMPCCLPSQAPCAGSVSVASWLVRLSCAQIGSSILSSAAVGGRSRVSEAHGDITFNHRQPAACGWGMHAPRGRWDASFGLIPRASG